MASSILYKSINLSDIGDVKNSKSTVIGIQSDSAVDKDHLRHAVVHKDLTLCNNLVTPENVNWKYKDDSTLLHILANVYNKKKTEAARILSLLLTEGAKVHAKDKEGNTPLHIAAREGHEEFCQILIDHQKKQGSLLELDMANYKKKMTPLHLASQQNQSKVIELLLEEGADPTLHDAKSYLPLHYAAEGGHHICCEILKHTYPKKTPRDRIPLSPLMLAARGGHHWCCERMDLSQEDLNYQDKQGNTPLHLASKKGFEKFVLQLVSKGASLNIENEKGNTPIMEAISRYTTSCLRALMDKGANLSTVNKKEKGVLHIAAEKKADECMAILLKDEGVKNDINRKDADGNTAFLIAIKEDYDKCSLMLLSEGASPTEECKGKFTPLHLATEHSTTNLLQRLLKIKDLNINPRDQNLEQTPLHLAAKKGSREACLRLLRRGARLDAKDKHSRTSLHNSAYQGHFSVVKLLIKRGANKRALDDKKSTPLHAAAAKGHLECCEMLVEADRQLCVMKDERGRFPLDVAIQKGNDVVFEFLLQSMQFRSINKLPPDMVRNLHSYTHKALKDENRTAVEAIIRSCWWEPGYGFNNVKHEKKSCDNFRQTIKQYPDLAKIILDKCITSPNSVNKYKSYNFRILEDNYYIETEREKTSSTNSKRSVLDQEEEERNPFVATTGRLKPEAREYITNPLRWKKDHPVSIMANYKRLHLLQHPLIKEWLSYKWHAYIRMVYIAHLLLKFCFVCALSGFMYSVDNTMQIEKRFNTTYKVFCDKITKRNASFPNSSSSQKDISEMTTIVYFNYCIIAWHIALLILTCLVLILEGNSIYKLRQEYLRGISNWLTVASVVLTAILLIPYPSCGSSSLVKPVFPWQCGIVAFFLSCICLINIVNKLPSCAFFATISHNFLKAYVKGVLVVLLMILTFAFIFYLLLLQDQKAFESLPQVVVKTVVWMLGDLGYDDTFVNQPVSYPVLTNILFLVFICIVGAFLVSLIKAPSTDPQKLALYKAKGQVELFLIIDTCYPQYRRKYAIGKYSGENRKSWIITQFEKLCKSKTHDSFIAKQLYPLNNKLALMNISDCKSHWIIEKIERIAKFFTLKTDEDENCFLPDEIHEKLNEQNSKLDQLLTICKQLHYNNQMQNEQIIELKQNYDIQKEQILELNHQLDRWSQTSTSKIDA